ncbi:sulfate permease [Hoyosella rhizosphaerae]|uniref:Sodium-independent anion transporter n=1 Tax=Hoyosella rhizosphaerae TaxID=1755582 RepID=A0A916U225_9ACTN|nr:sulfate permease [Hoyosella rhizosphaerae]MBN4926780.1 sulfate permease [Hoyosella rhizosphaerae]GGC56507.1 sodium-independent anion transporter [Hoyosella rhizosphaerae]
MNNRGSSNSYTMRHYRRAWLRPDVLAGITVAAYLIPQVMAYAAVAGLPPVVGLWAISAALIVYVFLGSSRQLSVGPESTTALMTAAAIGPLAAGDPQRYAALASMLALFVGVLCLIGWVARLGFLADLLSRPVLIGYMTGIAVIMIVSQLGTVTGTNVEGTSVAEEVVSFIAQLDQVHPPTLALALGTVIFLFLGARIWPRLPIPLLAVIIASAATYAFSLADHGIDVVGSIPVGVPAPEVPPLALADVTMLLLPALSVAIVGYTDNVLTARSFASRNGYRIDANREFLALGAANIASSLVKGFPVSSSASRTALGNSLGSKTQVHSLVALVVVLVALFVGGPVLALFPLAALGALVIYAAVKLIELSEFHRIATFRRSELFLAVGTVIAVLLFGVLYGVVAAVVLSLLDLLRRVARPRDAVLGYAKGIAGMHDIHDYPNSEVVPGLVVYRYDAPLFFANSEDFHRRAITAIESAATPTRWLVINAEAIVELDITAADMLKDLKNELTQRNITLAFARAKQELRDDLAAADLLDMIGSHLLFPTLPTAVEAYRARYPEH